MAKQVSPGVLALRKVVDDVHKDAREAKKRGELVGWSYSIGTCIICGKNQSFHIIFHEFT